MSSKRQRYIQPIQISDSTPVSDTELEDNVIRAMALFMAMNNLSIRIVTNDVFRELVNAIRALRSPYVMSRPMIRNETMNTHTELRKLLYARLSLPSTYTTIAFDGWTSCVGTKVTNVMAISKGVAYFIKSIPNPTERSTAEWLTAHITPLMDELIAAGVKVNAVVTDNGSVETAVWKEISKKYGLISVPCTAHTMQLIVKFILDKPEVSNIIEFFKFIVSSYQNCVHDGSAVS
jgi:hypothetical protein